MWKWSQKIYQFTSLLYCGTSKNLEDKPNHKTLETIILTVRRGAKTLYRNPELFTVQFIGVTVMITHMTGRLIVLYRSLLI